jgi:hypothetical protein
MSFYIRKALRVGPLRFNLSRSGIGVSAGIKGLRLGSGPRGNYVHMGRGGLYFRKSLGPVNPTPAVPAEQSKPAPYSPGAPAAIEMTEIESGSVQGMVDSTASDLLGELNTKRKRARLWPVAVVAIAGLVVLLAASGTPAWGTALALLGGTALTAFMYFRDQLRKTTVIFYELESHAVATYQRLHDAFDTLCASAAVWHVGAEGNVRDSKYHAGASTVVKRESIRPRKGPLPFVKVNVEVPTVPVGRQLLAFLPDRVLVFDPAGVGAVDYQDLHLELRQTRFIEDGTPPSDAKVVDYTWKYVNKKGGPDKRFKDYRQLPIALYDEVRIFSESGLNEMLQVSRLGVVEAFATAVKGLSSETIQTSGNAPNSPAT